MNIQSVSYASDDPINSRLGKPGSMLLGLLFWTVVCNTAMVGQSVAGNIIIINGVVYDDGGSQMVKGSGVLAREQRRVNEFHDIRIKGGVDVFFRRDADTRVELSGDDNLLKLIRTDVDGGVLTISSTGSYQTQMPLRVALTGPQLSAVEMDGSGDIRLTGLKEKFIRLDLNGSGDVNAEGRTEQLAVRLKGSGNVDAKNLTADTAEIQLRGSGDIDVNVRQLLDVAIIGSGNVTYFGNPGKIEQQIIGSGDIGAGD